MEQLIQEMISITGGVLSEEKAKQYLRFGKHDLGQALNYYYQAEERKQRQQPTVAQQKLMEGAKKQQKLQKIIKDLKMEYEKPIEECLDTRLPEKKQDVKLDFQPTNDIEEIAIQYANEKRAARVSEQKQQQTLQDQFTIQTKQEKKQKQKKQEKEFEEPQHETEKKPQQIQVKNLQGFQFPLFIGSGQVKGYAVGSQNLQEAQQQPLSIVLDATCKMTEKGKKSNKQIGQNIIRIYHKNNEIGRLNTEFEDLLAPLLQANLIIVHGQHVYSQIFCKTHDTIFLKIDVLLNQSAVTDATSDLFDDSQQVFVKFKDHFQKLYDILDCKLLVSTLVDVNKKKIEVNFQIRENNSSNYTTKAATVTFQDNPFKQKAKQMSLDEFKLKQNNQIQVVEKIENENEEDQKKEEDLDFDTLLGLKNCQHYDLAYHEPPEQLESELYNYQKQALTWLLQREGLLEQGKEDNTRLLHPLWKEYQNVQGLKFYFNPFSGQTSLQFPSSSQRCNGGILADEMGLGKTVMFISLILANPFKIPANFQISRQKQNSGKKLIADYVGYTKKRWAKTLIIVPVSLIQQWQDELIYHCKSNLKIYQYTGTDRNQYDLTQFDVIVSSYHTIGVEFKKQSRDPYSVYNYNWFRIILDEAHYIKGRTTNLAQAAYELDCYYRWCSTGTPIQNNLNDMFSLLHFIRLEPWSDYLWWNTYINKPHEEGQQEVFTLLNIILTPILLRRTKKSKDQNGDPIIQLPNKFMHFEKIELKPDEKLVYSKMETKSKDEVEGFLAKGILMSQYMKVFELLIRLRQICDHPLLITTRSDVKNIEQLEEQIDKFLSNQQLDREDQEELLMSNQQIQVCADKQQYKQEVLRRVKENDIPPCPICLEQVEDAVVTICLHFLCRLCLLGVLANKSECPFCRKFLTKQDTMTLPRESSFSLNWKENYRRSSKIDRVMKILSEIPKNDKCVIFTQFIGMIQMIEFDLDRQGVQYLRLDGSMPQQKRAEVLTLFKEENEYKVFIISLKAGGVGLNLTSANHVIMIDPWWNPAVEDQAIERVYRIGQNKEVHVYRLICNETVEERMIQMHEVKKQLFESSIMTEEKRSILRMEMFKNIILGK